MPADPFGVDGKAAIGASITQSHGRNPRQTRSVQQIGRPANRTTKVKPM
jgi:hypothetical protein